MNKERQARIAELERTFDTWWPARVEECRKAPDWNDIIAGAQAEDEAQMATDLELEEVA